MYRDDMLDARAELTTRIAAIDWRAGPTRLAPQIARLATLAQQHHMPTAADVATRLHAALVRGERDVPVRQWLASLGAAVVADSQASMLRHAA